MGIVIVVQPVGIQEFDERLAFYLRLRYIGKVDTSRIALVFYVKAELVTLDV